MERGQCSDDVRGRSFAPQVHKLVGLVNHKRHDLSIVSAVTNRSTMRWKIFEGALNADILIDFMKLLVRDAVRKVSLVSGNLRVHHSKPVKTWVAAHKDRIEVLYYPATARS
jgi:hypothetical protein